MSFASETVSLNLKWGVLQKLKVVLIKKWIDPWGLVFLQLTSLKFVAGGNQNYGLLMEKKSQGIRNKLEFLVPVIKTTHGFA
jgi:hypothetical protein